MPAGGNDAAVGPIVGAAVVGEVEGVSLGEAVEGLAEGRTLGDVLGLTVGKSDRVHWCAA